MGSSHFFSPLTFFFFFFPFALIFPFAFCCSSKRGLPLRADLMALLSLGLSALSFFSLLFFFFPLCNLL